MTVGNTFGEMEVLDVMPSAATIEAQTDVSVITISNGSLQEVFQCDAKAYALLLLNLARELSLRLRVANKMMVDGKLYDKYAPKLLH